MSRSILAAIAGRERRQLPIVRYAQTVLDTNVVCISIHLLICELVLSPSHVYVLTSVVFAQISHRPLRYLDARV